MKRVVYAKTDCPICQKKMVLITDSGVIQTYYQILVFWRDALDHLDECKKKEKKCLQEK